MFRFNRHFQLKPVLGNLARGHTLARLLKNLTLRCQVLQNSQPLSAAFQPLQVSG